MFTFCSASNAGVCSKVVFTLLSSAEVGEACRFSLFSLISSCRFFDDSIAKPHFDGLSIFRILNYERYMPLEVDASAFSCQNNERSLSLS